MSITGEDVTRWRAGTPGCAHRVHLNNAGAAMMPQSVVNAMNAHLDLEATIGGYEAADARAVELQCVYDSIAQLIGTHSSNVALVSSATAAFVQAVSSFDFVPSDIIVTSRSDYTSYQIQYVALARRLGVRIVHADDLPEGGIDPDSVGAILSRQRVRLVSVSWMPTHSGLIQDVESVGAVCREHGVPYHVDACQAVGQLPIEVGRLQCDYLSATGRKFLRGPRGTGFLYASDDAMSRGDYPLFVDMRGAEWSAPGEIRVSPTARRYEDWEFAYALVLGLGAAADYALNVGVAATGERAMELAQSMRDQLATIRGVRVLDPGRARSAIVTFDSNHVPAESMRQALANNRINTVLTRRWYGLLDFTARNVEVGIRASPHYYNTSEEIQQLVDVVRSLTQKSSTT